MLPARGLDREFFARLVRMDVEIAGAVAAARGRAEALAAAAGLSLGEPLRIEEDVGEMPTPMPRMAMLRAAGTEAAPTEIAAGEVEITARVRAWFSMA